MPTRVLLTGASGRVGSAIRSHLGDRDGYEFTYLDIEDSPEFDTFVGDIREYESIRPAFDDQDAVVHLAGEPSPWAPWDRLHELNLNGTYNVMKAVRDADVPKVVFASSNLVLGGYPDAHEGELGADHDVSVDHTDPPWPSSYYAVTKRYGEILGRYCVEYEDTPEQFYAARIGWVLEPEYDSPYGGAERGSDEGEFENGSDAYRAAVRQGFRVWCSRRDVARFTECALEGDTVGFDVFNVRSGGDRQWLEIDHAREVLGYRPADSTADYERPP